MFKTVAARTCNASAAERSCGGRAAVTACASISGATLASLLPVSATGSIRTPHKTDNATLLMLQHTLADASAGTAARADAEAHLCALLQQQALCSLVDCVAQAAGEFIRSLHLLETRYSQHCMRRCCTCLPQWAQLTCPLDVAVCTHRETTAKLCTVCF